MDMLRRSVLCLAILCIALPTWAGELVGVTLPDTATVEGKTLLLNGMGLRTKTFLKVKIYVAGLYIAAKSSDAAQIISLDEPKQLVMHFLYKEIDNAKLTEAWREGFANNSPSKLAALQERLDRFARLWPTVKSGDRAVMTYLPGVGTKVEVQGKELGVIPGKDFAEALFAVWLGDKPPNPELKTGLLGK
jgi:hypothetical protein